MPQDFSFLDRQAGLAGAGQPSLTLISHHLCPYVQRAVIALSEKAVPFRRIDIDLADKPDWFRALSPLGKTPVLTVGKTPVFESAVIVEYLEDTQERPLHPRDPLDRARHRAWMEFGSAILNDIAGLYLAPDADAFAAKLRALSEKFDSLERQLGEGPYFAGPTFSLVDAAFGPVFRYFDLFDPLATADLFADRPRVAAWRRALAARASVRAAVAPDYPERLRKFVLARGSHLAGLLAAQ